MMSREFLQRLPLLRRFGPPVPTVAVIRFEGVIGLRGRRGLNLRRYAGTIERAFKLRGLKAVALAINSPGGSPAQSALLYRRLRQLAAERAVPVIAFTEDVAASGGYWLALAADEIYAEDTSLVGSIGVVTAGFGFVQAMSKLGIERRLFTAGENKSMLDPFLPEREGDVARLKTLQQDLHDSFKDLVRERRGAKLKGDEALLFSGEVFTGRRALGMGLVDGIGELRGVLRGLFGDSVRLRPVEPERRRFSLARLAGPFGSEAASDIFGDVLTRLEERMIWARFGL
ncbi:MAG TPA: S49 family peptidase [Stellaceae bacterium]|jgi:signal peptide peptidase SppA|nr:S49 family peptidase [Stellaceae bacterium]